MKRLLAMSLVPLMASCATPQPAYPTFNAAGTDPPWALVIDDAQMVFTRPDAAPVATTRPAVIRTIRKAELYQSPAMDVNIAYGDCRDAGQLYTARVQVTVRGRRFWGCGGQPVADGWGNRG